MILYISPRFGARSDSVRLIEAARQKGVKTETLLNKWNDCHLDDNMAFYGEHAFCEFMAQEFGYNLISNSIDWVARLLHNFSKRDVKCFSLKEIMDIESKEHSIIGKCILQPADDPCFSTNIYSRFPDVPMDTPILVSSPHEWEVKFRFVIVDGKIITSCCYNVQEVFNTPTIWEMTYNKKGIDAPSFVKMLLSHNNTAPSCIIDVGVIKDAGWAVCGTYPVWSSEIYGCDPEKFLQAIFASCLKISK